MNYTSDMEREFWNFFWGGIQEWRKGEFSLHPVIYKADAEAQYIQSHALPNITDTPTAAVYIALYYMMNSPDTWVTYTSIHGLPNSADWSNVEPFFRRYAEVYRGPVCSAHGKRILQSNLMTQHLAQVSIAVSECSKRKAGIAEYVSALQSKTVSVELALRITLAVDLFSQTILGVALTQQHLNKIPSKIVKTLEEIYPNVKPTTAVRYLLQKSTTWPQEDMQMQITDVYTSVAAFGLAWGAKNNGR